MGVPKFFRWISERYPCLSVYIEGNQIPEFDCLYLDMNGIIHTCSHGNDHLRVISEPDMFKKMFDYIDHLFKIIKPREMFYMAVDGVAPRAKMNQQRSRRFKTANERKNQIQASIEKGELARDAEIFDSNAITPGTEFMMRLDEQLKQFIEDKMQSDTLWQGVNVIYSGHQTPGEGEHKIQEYIRYRRSLPDYNPYTKHCLYGLDADLIILGLASHEPYFALLREEVLFNKKKDSNSTAVDIPKFHLLYISLLRDYIELEFQDLKQILGPKYNRERLYDDWIIMTFFVGNDFIPHLPKLHIHSSALPRLWQNYKDTRPKMMGYLVENGVINIENLMIYIQSLATFDKEMFESEYEDMRWMMGKRGEKMGDMLEQLGNIAQPTSDEKLLSQPIPDIVEGATDNVENILDTLQNLKLDNSALPDKDNEEDGLSLFFDVDDKNTTFEPLQDMTPLVTKPLCPIPISEQEDMTDDEVFEKMYVSYKRDYYQTKMYFNPEDIELVDNLAIEYLRAFQWISFYYFCGVQSWSWYYPEHYAPFLSDLPNINPSRYPDIKEFELNTPFMSFQQLMAVLPPDSANLVPACYRSLFTQSDSPILDFYPKTFNHDLNGKKADWEAIVIIPFINETRLIEAMNQYEDKMTSEERARNIHRPAIEYTYCTSSQALSMGQPINKVLKHIIDLNGHRLERDKIVFGLLFNKNESDRIDLIRYGGFPTLFSESSKIKFVSKLEENFEVKLFESTSKKPCAVLRILPKPENDEQNELAEIRKYLNQIVYVNWPVISQVKVKSVVKGFMKYQLDQVTSEIYAENFEDSTKVRSTINHFRESESRRLSFKKGIVIDQTNDIVLESCHSLGRKYYLSKDLELNCETIWDENHRHMYLEQLAVLPEKGTRILGGLASGGICTKIDQLAPEGSLVFLLDPENYGLMAEVVNHNESNGNLRVEIRESNQMPIKFLNIEEFEKLDFPYFVQQHLMEYLPVHIDYNVISRITGYLPVKQSPEFTIMGKKQRSPSTFNIGLNMKSNKGPGQLADWIIKVKVPSNQDSPTNYQRSVWKYTVQVVKLLEDYIMRFPEVIEFLSRDDYEKLDTLDIFRSSCADNKEKMENKLNQLKDFLADLPFHTIPRLENEHQILRQKAIKYLESISWSSLKEQVPMSMEVPLSSVWCPHPSLATACPDLSAYHNLLDRVVSVVPSSLSCSIPVPLGAKGVIIGMEPVSMTSGFHTLEILFDSPFPGAISIRNSSERCYKLSENFVINLTYNYRKQNKIPRRQTNQNNRQKVSAPTENVWRKPVVIKKNVSSVNPLKKETKQNIPSSTSQKAATKTTMNTTDSFSKYSKKTSDKALSVNNKMENKSSSVGVDKEIAECSFDFDSELPPQPPIEFLLADPCARNDSINNNYNKNYKNSSKKDSRTPNKSLTKLPKSESNGEMRLRASDLVTVTKCPPVYSEIIQWCLSQKILDPSLTVNYYEDKHQKNVTVDAYVGMIFVCRSFLVPEIITSSWEDTINQMYYNIEVNVQQLYASAFYQHGFQYANMPPANMHFQNPSFNQYPNFNPYQGQNQFYPYRNPNNQFHNPNQFYSRNNQFHNHYNQFTNPNNQFTNPNNQFTYPNNQFTNPDNQFTNPNNQFTNPNNQYPNQYRNPNQFHNRNNPSTMFDPYNIVNNPFTQSYQDQQMNMNRFIQKPPSQPNKLSTNKSPIKPQTPQSNQTKSNAAAAAAAANSESTSVNNDINVRPNRKFVKAPKPNIGMNFSK